MSGSLQDLFNTLPQIGKVEWIGVRPERKAPMLVLDAVEARSECGLTGDRYNGRNGKRHVTLIQFEHLAVISSLLGRNEFTPELLRRNIAVSGINLLALKDKRFQIGGAVLEYTGSCHPCSVMEATFGEGGYNAVRGHGGITARIVESGVIRRTDPVRIIQN
jgi:MOSC domain-containing protein YiiM